MIARLVFRGLAARPVRAAVLGGGFGLGIAVMAVLLGVGEVVLEQSRSPDLRGGGDLLVTRGDGRLESARFVLSLLEAPPLDRHVAAASPRLETTLFMVREGSTVEVEARGGVPSLERAVGDPGVAGVAAWKDAPADAAWSDPDPGEVLRAMDRFHPVPASESRARSWAEWLYFNGRSDDGSARFYLTFFAGPPTEDGLRSAGVRLQLDRRGGRADFSARHRADPDLLLREAPDLAFGPNTVRLEGLDYRISLDLEREGGGPGLRGELVLRAVPGRSVPPLELRGARGWVSGYTVPVLSGELEGWLSTAGERIEIRGGTGYHDHNWGSWEGVTWKWGQAAGGDLSFLYGQVRPPADAADRAHAPGFLAVVGPHGPLGFAMSVSIVEEHGEGRDHPDRIVVSGSADSLDLRLVIEVEDVLQTPWTGLAGPDVPSRTFFQMRGTCTARGRAGGREIDLVLPAAAETFR